jgi:protein TonB
MFETSLVSARARTVDRRLGFLSFSIALHTAAVAALIAASVASTRLPIDSPKMLPVFFAPVVPPALGNPDAGHPSKPAEVPHVVTAPQTVPDQIPSPPTQAFDSIGPKEGDGPPGPDGVPWGLPDGVGNQPLPANVAPDKDGPLPVTGSVKAPVVIRRITPEYPRLALQARKNGYVVLECIIDKTGRIRDARVKKSSFGAFEQPALDAVQQWMFAPGTLNGQPVDTIFELTVTFQVR